VALVTTTATTTTIATAASTITNTNNAINCSNNMVGRITLWKRALEPKRTRDPK